MTAKEPVRSKYRGWQQQQYYEDSLCEDKSFIMDGVQKQEKDSNQLQYLYRRIKIYTTIDSRMQKYAEEAVYERSKNTWQPRFFKEKTWT